MDKNKICEALYALPEGAVVRRRKSMVMPVALLLAGAALIVVNNVVNVEISNNLRSALVFVGGTLACAGLIVLLARLFGAGGAPFHSASKSYLTYEELYFDHKMWRDVVQCVSNGEVSNLRSMPHSDVPAVTVAMYAAPNGQFAAMQAFEYADLEYRPLSELKIVSN